MIKRRLKEALMPVLLFFAGAIHLKAQTGQQNIQYIIKVTEITSDVAFKEFCSDLDALFDTHAHFNDSTNEITILSDQDVSSEKLSRKLTNWGYTLQTYKQVFTTQSPR